MKSFIAKAILVIGTIFSSVFGIHKELAKDVPPKSQTASVVSSQLAKPSSATSNVGIGTTSPNQATTPPKQNTYTLSKTEVESIVNSKINSLINSGKLKGPKGERGEKGDTGPAGQNGSSGITTSYTTPSGYSVPTQNLTVAYTPPGASNPGSVGNITYFASKELTTDKLTVNDTANLNKLNVTGASTFSSLLASSILPQTAGSVTAGVVTTEILTSNPNGSGGGGLYNDSEKFIAVGNDGFVRFVYFDNHFQDVHFVRCIDNNCSTKNDNIVAADSNGVDSTLIKMGADGYPRILYINYETPNELHFIKCTNEDCSSKTDNIVDTGNYYEVAFDLDSSDKPFIVYNERTNNPREFKLAVCSNSDCSFVSTSLIHTYSLTDVNDLSIKIASDGFPRIVYADGNTDELHFMRCSNVDCSVNIDTLVTSVSSPYYLDLVLGSDGYGRIVYQDYPTYEKFVQCTNADCSTKNITTLDSATSGSSDQISIVMGKDGFPRILYDYYNPSSVYYVQCTNDSCSARETKLITSEGGYPTSLALGLDGLARILYLGTEDYKTLYIARLGTVDGNEVISGSTLGTSDSRFAEIFGKRINVDELLLNGITFTSISPSQWTTNSSNIYFNTGNVGIGTSTPNKKLSIWGSLDATLQDWNWGGVQRLSVSADSNKTWIQTGDNGVGTSGLEIHANNNSPLILSAHNGNVDLDPGPYNGTNRYQFSGYGDVYTYVKNDVFGTQTYSSHINLGLYDHTNKLGQIYLQPAIDGSLQPGLIIKSQLGGGANVGIGTTNPTSPLHVSGGTSDSTYIQGSPSWGNYILDLHSNYNSGSGGDILYASTNSYGIYKLTSEGREAIGQSISVGSNLSTSSSKVALITGQSTGATTGYGLLVNTQLMSDVTGTFYAGYFEPNTNNQSFTISNIYSMYLAGPASQGASPTYVNTTGLRIANQGRSGGSSAYGLYIDSQTGSADNYSIYSAGGKNYFAGSIGIATSTPWKTFSVTGTVALDGLTSGAGAGTLCLSSSKEVTYSNGATCTVSSARFKHDIATSTTGLDFVKKLRPVTFFYNDDIGVPGQQYGFIAEEVEQLDPRLVVHDKDNKPFSVRYENMAAVLAKAIQEQQTQIDQIKASTTGPIIHDSSSLLSDLQYYSNQILTGIWHFVEIVTDKITATLGVFKRVETEEICISANGDKTCITKQELDELLHKNSISMPTPTVNPSPSVEPTINITPTPDNIVGESGSVATTEVESAESSSVASTTSN